jgi:processive 1,2-diacylglycerol beta-glucosyltransferase
MEHPALLVLSARAGTGHLQAARTIRDALDREIPGARVEHVDVLDMAPSWVGRAYADGFELLASRVPWVWGGIYRTTDGPREGVSSWWTLTERLLFRKFRPRVMERDWDLCIATHFLPCQLAAARTGGPPFWLAVTDFTLHRYWVQPAVSHYFLPPGGIGESLESRVHGASTEVTGIPVAPGFTAPPSRSEARRVLDLDPRRPTVLVMSGGLGLGIEERVRSALDATGAQVQLLAVCGHNQQARKALSRVDPMGKRLRVLGYVRDVPTLMAASDLVVTKPGGLTISEALAVGRPLLLTRALPGHEAGNARRIAELGAAAVSETPSELGGVLRSLLSRPERLRSLASAARELGRPDAAARVSNAVRRRIPGGNRAAVA